MRRTNNICNITIRDGKMKDDCCTICGLKLEGWIYYQKADFKICHFCYNDLEIKGDE